MFTSRKNTSEINAPGKKRGGAPDNQPTPRTSPAETAYLVGPGSLKIRGGLPIWKPVAGNTTKLHPEYLKRIVVFGLADCSGKVFSLLWRKNVQVIFLSPHGNKLLAHIHPGSNRPGLARTQHVAATDPDFSLRIARSIVIEKLDATRKSLRYYQQQSAISNAGSVLKKLDRHRNQAGKANSISALLGCEGSAARLWREQFGRLLPTGWVFTKRKSRPPTDPVNALLSLGYTLLVTRCQTMLAAADFDPYVGFLHQIRPGRPSLACDLMEPLRIEFVDRWALRLLNHKTLTKDAFTEGRFWQAKKSVRLKPNDFKKVVGSFEKEFIKESKRPSWRNQTEQRIRTWSKLLSNYPR